VPDIAWNQQVWGEKHGWQADGDEWNGMAAHCGQPYPAWKAALVEEVLLPSARDADVLEIAPGHGRFSAEWVPVARSAVLVDLNQSCLDACRQRLEGHDVTYVLTDGTTLPGVPDASIDFVWSFDSFVHMEPDVISAYLREIRRVLRPGGRFTLHHAGKHHATLGLAPVARRAGTPGRVAYRWIAQQRWRDSGGRSEVSRRSMARMVEDAGLTVGAQVRRWGPDGQFDVTKYGDWITTGVRP
jgi:ubiquinone/menaquinone biosynthesis C-methylase UbiE